MVAQTTALTPHVEGFSTPQLELIKRHVAPGIPNDELAFFAAQCRRTGLDPFTKQIYCIERGGKWTVQPSIDGFRLVASRTGELAGIDDATYDTEAEEHPGRALVNVYRLVNGYVARFSATARWGEYVQRNKDGNPANMWAKMPYLMLGKCAEALALRKAFPAELSGLYTPDEMAQAENDEPPHVNETRNPPAVRPMAPAQPAPKPAAKAKTLPHWKTLERRANYVNISSPTGWEELCRTLTGKDDAHKYTLEDYDIVERDIQEREAELQAQHELGGVAYTDDPSAPIGTSLAADAYDEAANSADLSTVGVGAHPAN